mgnify:CR=1 FL=1
MTDPASVRAYDPDAAGDRRALWRLKTEFETELGAKTGTAGKSEAYEAKLTDEYRERWLDWVERCVEDDGQCVSLAEVDGVVGYVFVLPERLSFVWDAAVVNELYVVPGARGTGVADALLERAVDVAREQDLPLDRLLLDVDESNGRARRFYERHGFEPWGEIVARELR